MLENLDEQQIKMLSISDNSDKIVNINNLNDDCLVGIFEYLTIKEKLQLELVSKRWNAVAKRSWSYVTYLETCPFIEDNINEMNLLAPLFSNIKLKEKNTNLLITILSRCARYLSELNLGISSTSMEFQDLQNPLIEHGKQLTSLIVDDRHIDDRNLEFLFQSLKNLRSLSLKNINVKGICFEKLKENNIEEFSIQSCKFTSSDHVREFIVNLKKLNRLKILSCDKELASIIIGILTSIQYENVIEFSLQENYRTESIIISDFLSRQKNLKKLILTNSLGYYLSFDTVPDQHLKVLKLGYECCEDEEMNKLFNNHLHNLETLSLIFETELNKSELEIIFKFIKINIKNLELQFPRFEPHQNAEEIINFSRLTNLESFSIYQTLDYNKSCLIKLILDGLLTCKNLKKLSIHNFNLTSSEFNTIKKFVNLEKLNLTSYVYVKNTNIGEEDMCELIKEFKNLKELELHNFEKVTDKLIKSASEIKENRRDFHKLKIIIKNRKIRKLYFSG